MQKLGKVTAIIDMGLGSSGKGVVARYLQGTDKFDYAVRVGAPNAGHSLEFGGKLYKMQSIPCNWIDPDCALVIGAGGLINVKILAREIEEIKQVYPNILSRLFVDANCGILDQVHADAEGHDTQGNLKSPIGSTAEGVGAARIARIQRDPAKFRLARDCQELRDLGVKIVDFAAGVLVDAIKNGKSVVLEGSQGTHLSLYHGQWPYVTSGDSSPACMLGEIGIPAQFLTEVVGVARTYPIRVANPTLVEGTSGPLKNETSWEEISKKIGREVQEMTTVTKRIRRVGEWDDELFGKSVILNAPTYVALTFADYLDAQDYGRTSYGELSQTAKDFITRVETEFGVKIGLVGTGFDAENGWTCIDLRNREAK